MKTPQEAAEECMGKFNDSTKSLNSEDWQEAATILRDFFEAIIEKPDTVKDGG